jgi:uncharacterized protein
MVTLLKGNRQTSTMALTRFTVRHPVAAFLGLVYGISWLLFLPALLSQLGLGLLPFALPLPPFLLLSVILGLTLPGYIVTRVAEGKEGVRALRRRYTRWRFGLGWYLLALFGLPVADLLGASLWLGAAPLAAFVSQWELLGSVFLPRALINAALINSFEEGGWTGFLLPRLQERWGPLRASALVAFAMGLFHTPLVFIVGGVSDTPIAPGQYWYYFFFLFVAVIPVRVLMTWLWNRTRGSVIAVALLHGAFNVTTGPDFLPAFVPGDRTWVYGVYTALALLVLAFTRGRLGYRPGEAPRPE